MTGKLAGLCKQFGAFCLLIFTWARQRDSLFYLYTRIPFGWRLAVRKRMHALAGVPMPPVPFGDAGARIRMSGSLRPAAGPGINLLGYARGEFGVAENVRSYARALQQTSYPFLIFDLDAGMITRQRDYSMESHFSNALRYSTNVFFVNADQMQIARDVLGRKAFAGRRNIGFWVWELGTFPDDWHGAFELVDEVWVPTSFVRDTVAACTKKPVLRMPKAIEFEPPLGIDREHFALPSGEFVFLFSFDFNSSVNRKNPGAVIAAFKQAFCDSAQGVRLLVKSTNGGRFPDKLAALRQSVADDPRIEVHDGFLSRTEMFGLQNNVDCYVSLHRAEGFGLGMAECMYLGKPVIATGYSGNLDFMNESNSLLVDYRMIPLRDGDYMRWQGQYWADPDVAHAARLMRRVFDDRELARRVGAAAASSIRASNSKAVCGATVSRRLREIDRGKAAR